MRLQFKTDRGGGHRCRINTDLPALVPEEGLVTQAALRCGLGVRPYRSCELRELKVAPEVQSRRGLTRPLLLCTLYGTTLELPAPLPTPDAGMVTHGQAPVLEGLANTSGIEAVRAKHCGYLGSRGGDR
jgi:hypothetical protein